MALVTTILAFLITSQSPGVYLRAGDKAIESARWQVAISLYKKALETDYISPPARAMAYWNLSVAYENIEDTDGLATSLLGFIVHTLVVRDYVDSLSSAQHKTNPSARWLKYFQTKERLQIAAQKLQLLWDQRNENKTREVYNGGDISGP